ncbi:MULTISPECIES: ABC transporter permease [Pseudonocardia]|uniref:Peptide ABC transporter permease n=2 Tax=Pseudonocardia TaxID=1847 RepID=A0ABQ0S813_9PSEU|nr:MULTISPECIES: ABC transporter permease [Pseudonocardia]OSY34803.1 putative D,D-dipeptide transport system permease protein DdpC [Pseudonocardia autotrophica]TDN76940.1 peptide/nickel transport system permease protein [Pseudonocardia autotrophica]BBG00944.1 peptide ABC transporter permease [Pseudonocardia autotrophica]GEC29054.1 peptide ABC transporter permease [Pseudonocardia saturnea]
MSTLAVTPRRRAGRTGSLLAGSFLGAMLLAVVFAGVIFPEGYDAQDVTRRFAEPTWFGPLPLGTDELGRDLLARVLYGGRPALGISAVAAVLATVLGAAAALGATLGGRPWDGIIGRIADVQLAVPTILIALVVLSFSGSGTIPLIGVLTVGSWVLTFRILRAQLAAVVALPYIEAARLAGAQGPTLLRRHVLPAAAPLAVVALTLNFSTALVLESSLGYLGLGIAPPRPDWGQIVASGQAQLAGAWWISIVPGAFLVATVVSIQIVGDRIADLLTLPGSQDGTR